MTLFEGLDPEGLYAGRIEGPEGPLVVRWTGGVLSDVTCRAVPTMRDLLEREDVADWLRAARGREVAEPEVLLAPCDLQAVKACGVTFARSMIERVIEERAGGDSAAAEAVRARIADAVGQRLRDLVPGSEKAAQAKAALQAEGLWSQYLEVGIGPDAEVFTKCPPMAAVGSGAEVGIHPASDWNNPEPEIVLAVDSRGVPRGATLGNDVNLRDVEGRSALLLGKAKDNNASAAIGPMVRLFDEGFGMEDVRRAEIVLRVEGADGFVLTGRSSMSEISRDPEDLVAQAIGPHHQYPDGLMLYLGTLFSPVEDRDAPGQGFTHKPGDRVEIAAEGLGRLVNTVGPATECPPWTLGAGGLMRNLAGRGLL
ncbi:fumarylacetoacetate hydrolase family protein [Histidinibacterium aquaticum]|uniref:Fumarylacetoacetate hydrolase family protein n=1 Tax=Histidinibacterium aquaticum TaxID=2613962 RepID=A0A5J5GKB4_9RHOB|nr:fumarylacetoacetate hydrolase family protein [Histidinibacterium aquaticum]KAA9007994.1 fumarylacetoacetate hydrolase family protein [Histidinibacterium aquaticum]